MNFVKSFLSRIVGIFKSGKAEKAFNAVADLVPRAQPIVETIAALTPTKADDEIVAAYNRFGVPLLKQIDTTPAEDRGYLLLGLATQVLSKRYPGVATNILQSAIQLAVTAYKAK